MFPAEYYLPVYINLVLIMSIAAYYKLQLIGDEQLFDTRRGMSWMVLFCIVFVICVGLRPISGYYFGDTSNYALTYRFYHSGAKIYNPDTHDWLFQWMMSEASQIMDVSFFFLIVEAFYVIPMLWACRRLFPNNTSLAMLFCIGAFSFFTYGTNGIRNGMACSIVILALSFANGSLKEKIIAGCLCFCAYNIHNSTILPILSLWISTFYHNSKIIIGFWFASILVSLVAGNAVSSFFISLGFDDRMESYAGTEADAETFSRTGFRWDFLLYSVMPILLGWYVIIKRKICDRNFQLLLNTYLLSNAFWVMVIRASYSNRFAYLSWFMYPIVLAYPLFRISLWENQGKKAGLILFLHFGFTYFMWLIEK